MIFGSSQVIFLSSASYKQLVKAKLTPNNYLYKHHIDIAIYCWMSKKEQILYQDPRKASYSDLTDALSMSFSTVEEEHDQNLQGNIALAQTEHRER